MKATGALTDRRESFLLDGGAPFYRVYACSDGGHMAVGSIEPQFFAQLLAGLGFAPDEVPHQYDLGRYDEMRTIFAEPSEPGPATSGPRCSPAPAPV